MHTQELASVDPHGRHKAGTWARVPIARIEDLKDAVFGAGLEAAQLSRAPVTGSLVFGHHYGITCSSGFINGRVALAGPLSESMVTFGIGLRLAPGTRHWLNEVRSGDVGLFLPGDEHDALYSPGSLYATVSLCAERIEEVAAEFDLILDPLRLGGSGVDGRQCSPASLVYLEKEFSRIHAEFPNPESPDILARRLLSTFVQHFGREPRKSIGKPNPHGFARIVARARSFIHGHINEPLSVDAIARAVSTSPRSLHRAFQIVLGETPYSYVVKLRLNRIRAHLISDSEILCTITTVANSCGISELGRFSRSYAELFGELPSETRKRCQVIFNPEA